jgi:hypothetical protein
MIVTETSTRMTAGELVGFSITALLGGGGVLWLAFAISESCRGLANFLAFLGASAVLTGAVNLVLGLARLLDSEPLPEPTDRPGAREAADSRADFVVDSKGNVRRNK